MSGCQNEHLLSFAKSQTNTVEVLEEPEDAGSFHKRAQKGFLSILNLKSEREISAMLKMVPCYNTDHGV